jgi:acyl carrier protein
MREQVIRLLQRVLPKHQIADALNEDTDLMDELGVDSLDLLGVATALEEEFGLTIADHEWRELRSLQNIMRLVCERRPVVN